MAQATIKNLKERIAAAEKRRDSRIALNKSAYELAMPQRNVYNNINTGSSPSTTEGKSNMTGLFTSLGMSTVNNFVNNIQSSLTPPFTRFAELRAGEDISEDIENEVNEALDLLTKKIFTFLNASNFATASAEMYHDLAVGTGALLFNKGTSRQPLNFQAVPSAQLSLEEGTFGTIGGVFRKNCIKARLIQPSWPDANIPDSLKKIITDSPEKEIILDEVSYYDQEEDKWYYEIIWMPQSNDEGERLLSRVTAWSPWIILRWTKMPGEVEGRGLLLQAMPDLKMLNHGKEMAAMTAQMNAFGAYTAEEDGIIDAENATITPGGILMVKTNPGGAKSPSIAALPRVGDTRDQEMFFQNIENDVKRIMMDNKLPTETASVRSATEIVQRIKEFQADFGAAFGRLMYEYIYPLFKTTLLILEAEQKIIIPTIPVRDTLTGQIVNKKITDDIAFTKIKMLSPAAKVQALEDIQNTMRAIQLAQSIEPRIAMIGYKVEEIPNYLAENLGMPDKFVRTKPEQQEAMKTLATLMTTGMESTTTQ